MTFADNMELIAHENISGSVTGDAACLANDYADAVYDVLQERYKKEQAAKLRRSARLAAKKQ